MYRSEHEQWLAEREKVRRRAERELGPLGSYAFGFSDIKPGLAYWLIMAAMVVFALFSAFKVTHVG